MLLLLFGQCGSQRRAVMSGDQGGDILVHPVMIPELVIGHRPLFMDGVVQQSFEQGLAKVVDAQLVEIWIYDPAELIVLCDNGG